MFNTDLSNIILNDHHRITEAISTGSGWEIWMQIELTILLKQAGLQAAREVPYPNSSQRLDILTQDTEGRYAIELKVESATNSGTALLPAVQQDIEKIVHYTEPTSAKWVVAICYSDTAKSTLENYASNPMNNAIFNCLGAIGCMIVTAP